MDEAKLVRIIVWVAALFVAAASEFFPMLGLLAAAVVFPEGIRSYHPDGYIALALILNFLIFFAATFLILSFFSRRMTLSKRSR